MFYKKLASGISPFMVFIPVEGGPEVDDGAEGVEPNNHFKDEGTEEYKFGVNWKRRRKKD
jgi:hypothetical protein